jgi:2-C-methyl-D-erythritol 4-phosphate cytidylyltransferase
VEPLYCGGGTRRDSVLNGLVAISPAVNPDDWVLVHDAARPCLPDEMLDKLLTEVADVPVGGLLAVPVADTLKRAAAGSASGVRSEVTVPRAGLWQAQTPQMFRHGMLVDALRAAGSDMTDEASAIEQLGLQPRLVESDSRNLKVTYPQDMELASLIQGKLNE